MSILEKIQNHSDLVGLTSEERKQLCDELRQFLVSNVSRTGGHVASNLGVVELTVAIETVYNTFEDRLVFDVGHQSYIHKILTGRREDFASLRQFGGISGFPRPCESDADAFVAGHASSSVSIALGMARARTMARENYDVVALIGDGSATGGIAFEGLNDAAVSGEPLVVILNDNELSIDRNVGGMASHLRQLRIKDRYLGMKERYRNFLLKLPGGRTAYRFARSVKDWLRRILIPATIFESMGFSYLGPVDGHDTEKLISLLRIAKETRRPVLLHVITQKGKGYAPSEEHPKLFHGIGKFDLQTGEPAKKDIYTFSDAFGNTMMELAQEQPRLCAITAAMPGGTGLLEFKNSYSKRLFDVGIAEEHAVSMAGGLAKQGMIPVVALYSTFLQRAYDMILQDVCMLGLHVVFAIDRAGLVGEDGPTHHGVFDIGFLRHAPGMTVLCPASTAELADMLRWAVEEQDGPVAVRYPRGGDRGYTQSAWVNDQDIVNSGAIACHRRGADVTIITYGTIVSNVMEAAAILEQRGVSTTVLRLMSVEPLPIEQILEQMSETAHIVVVEEVSGNCGISQAIALEVNRRRNGVRVDNIDLGCRYLTHGNVEALYQNYGLDANGIADFIQEVHQNEN